LYLILKKKKRKKGYSCIL